MKPHIKDKLKDLRSNTNKVQLTTGRLKAVPKELKLCFGIKYLDLFSSNQGLLLFSLSSSKKSRLDWGIVTLFFIFRWRRLKSEDECK